MLFNVSMPLKKLRQSSKTVLSAILGSVVIRSDVSVLMGRGTGNHVKKTDLISAQPRTQIQPSYQNNPAGQKCY